MSVHPRPRALLCLPATLLALALLPVAASARVHRPTVTTLAATNITASSATLTGSVNPNNSSTTYYFQYGTSTAYGSTTASGTMSSGTSAINVNVSVSRLEAATTYHYRLIARNAQGTTYGSDGTFTSTGGTVTAPAPTVATSAASGISASAATVNGSVNPNGASTSYHFEYGTGTAYGSSTGSIGAGSGTSALAEQAGLSGLSGSTTYHYRLVAANSGGTSYGQDMTLSTTASGVSGGGSSYDQTVLADHPVAYWDMNTPSGAESDLTGNGHTGAYKGGTPTLASLPNGDKAADFNGSTQYMTVPSSAAFSIPTTHQFTWESWIRPDTFQWSSASDPYKYGYVDWMGKCENYGPTCEWESRAYATTNAEGRCNRVSAYVFNPSAGLGSAADWQPNCNLLQAGQWLHVVGEYQTLSTPSGCNSGYPGTINIWVNGVEWNSSYHMPTGCMSQYNIKPTANSSPLDIGTMAMDSWFPGAVGKVALYDSLLSQSQITAHFNAMTGAQPSGSCQNSCTIPVPTP